MSTYKQTKESDRILAKIKEKIDAQGGIAKKEDYT